MKWVTTSKKKQRHRFQFNWGQCFFCWFQLEPRGQNLTRLSGLHDWLPTRWARIPVIKWGYNPYTWLYKLVTGAITPISSVITLLITDRGLPRSWNPVGQVDQPWVSFTDFRRWKKNVLSVRWASSWGMGPKLCVTNAVGSCGQETIVRNLRHKITYMFWKDRWFLAHRIHGKNGVFTPTWKPL